MAHIDFHCTISADDLVDAHYVHIRPRRVFALLGIGIILLALAVFAWTVVQAVRGGPRSVRFVLLAAVMGLGSVLVSWVLLSYYPRLVKRAYSQQKALHGPIQVHVDETGVQVHTDFVNAVSPWSHYLKWKESERIFLLYQTNTLFQVFPKRCMDAQSIEGLRGILSSKVSPAA